MINPIHITKLKLLYDVELAKQIGGYQKAKPLKKKKIWKKNKFESKIRTVLFYCLSFASQEVTHTI